VAQLSTVKFEETGEEERGAGSVADEDGRTGTLDGLFEDFGEEDAGFFGFVLRESRSLIRISIYGRKEE
jgi:hypothetical protein